MENFDLGSVVRLDVYSIGVYQPMAKRAYAGMYSADLEEDLAAATEDFASFTGSKFFGIAADILELTDEHIEAFIEGGWDKPRLRFLLELANPVPGRRGVEQRTVVTGYLDSDDVVLEEESELIEDTLFTVNNIVQYTVDIDKNQSKRKYNGKVINSRNSNGGAYNGNTISQTTGHAVTMISLLGLEEVMDDDDEEVIFPDVSEGGARLVSSRQNNAANYISDTTTALNVSSREIQASPTPLTSRSWNDLGEEVVSRAEGYLSEKGLNSVPILAELALINEAFVEDSTFLYSDLLSIYNGLDDVVEIIYTDAEELSALEDSEILDDSAEAEIALILAMACPSIAFDHLMGVCEIDLDTSSEEIVAVTSATPIIPEYTNIVLAEDFTYVIEHNLAAAIDSWESRYGVVYARAIIDAFGDSTIIVSLDGNAECSFVIPQFADNSFTPLLSQDLNTSLSISQMLLDVSVSSYRARYDEESPLGDN